jgi:hypothetical protein
MEQAFMHYDRDHIWHKLRKMPVELVVNDESIEFAKIFWESIESNAIDVSNSNPSLNELFNNEIIEWQEVISVIITHM